MLTAIHVGNFKAFGETQRVPLKALTFVFGPNSAGKSSVVHSLALAHEARRTGSLDVFRTDVGGTSIDLGGFRQYVFRRDPSRHVEWWAELDVRVLTGRIAELLAPCRTATVAVSFGLPVDDHGYAPTDALTELVSYRIEADGSELLRASARRDRSLGVDRLASDHPVFSRILGAIVEGGTTTALRAEDREVVEKAIAEMMPGLSLRVGRFLPDGMDGKSAEPEGAAGESMLFPVSAGSREEDLADAVRFYLPRILNELLTGMERAVGEQLDRFQYLGPLRSYPPRHLVFSEQDDSNWSAGGGYAWDVVRRDRTVREQVNEWLGADWLKTNYRLVLRELVALDELEKPVSAALEAFEYDEKVLGLEVEYDDRTGQPTHEYPVIKDPEEAVSRVQGSIETSDIDRLPELILIDQSNETVVSHRDVGIGISQVLPVLVSCYGLRGRIVAIEQPEIHLHPALQAELADVFIDSALGERRNSFILESHSEHLMLRVLRRIRETGDPDGSKSAVTITPSDVAVLYVEPAPGGAQIVEIPITEEGDFARPWPEGFFAERVKELF